MPIRQFSIDILHIMLGIQLASGHMQVAAPKSAVSGEAFGHLVVTMKEPRKASLVMRDLSECALRRSGMHPLLPCIHFCPIVAPAIPAGLRTLLKHVTVRACK